MLIWKPLSYSSCMLAILVSISLFALPSVNADTCSNVQIKPQPLAIDFASGLLSAAYAYADDNVTSLGWVQADETTLYVEIILRLQSEHKEQQALKRAAYSKSQLPKTWTQIVVGHTRHYFNRLRERITFLDHPIIKISTTLNFFQDLWSLVYVAIKGDETPVPDNKYLTAESIKEGFIEGLRALQEMILARNNMTITFAVLSVPDFFNSTVKAILKQACEEVGINIFLGVDLIMSRSHAGALGAQFPPDFRILALDQGLSHFAISLFQDIPSLMRPGVLPKSIPYGGYGSEAIFLPLMRRLFHREGDLREQVRGADPLKLAELEYVVEKARSDIKGNVDVLDGKSYEDYHHEEWPLDSKNFWGGKGKTLVLRWEDVKAAEDEYVGKLYTAIVEFLVVVRREKEKLNIECTESIITEPLQDIDSAVILTDYVDGELLKRAIDKVVGRRVEIVSGALGDDFMLAAKGAARVAWRRIHWDRSALKTKENKHKEI